MAIDTFIDEACRELVSRHGVHTILLYGSRANGAEGADSDYDLAGFGSTAVVLRDARLVGDAYLDAFVYPEAVLLAPTEEHLKLRGSKVLLGRDSRAAGFLGRLEELHRRGPAPLPADEIAARKAWAHKMVQRIRRSDAEGTIAESGC